MLQNGNTHVYCIMQGMYCETLHTINQMPKYIYWCFFRSSTNKSKRRKSPTENQSNTNQRRIYKTAHTRQSTGTIPHKKQLKREREKMKLKASLEDMSEWREVDFALQCTYIVHDQASEPNFSLPKAMTSIPRNLTFQYSMDNQVQSAALGCVRNIPNSLISTDC